MEESVTTEIVRLARTKLPDPYKINLPDGHLYRIPIAHHEIYGFSLIQTSLPQPYEKEYIVVFELDLARARWIFIDIT